MIVNRPNVLKDGQVVDDLVDFSDFLPTFVELAGGSPPTGNALNGISFAARIRRGQPSSRKWAYAEGRGGQYWVRNQRYKLYDNGTFLDLAANPSEDKRNDLRSKLSPHATATRSMLQEALESVGQ